MMEMLKDLYKKVTGEQNPEEEVKQAERSLNLVGDIARKCLTYPEFEQYRSYFKRVEAELIDTMILYTKNFVESDKGDVTKYALTMVRLFTKLQDYRWLLRNVESDAKKKRVEVKEPVAEKSAS